MIASVNGRRYLLYSFYMNKLESTVYFYTSLYYFLLTILVNSREAGNFLRFDEGFAHFLNFVRGDFNSKKLKPSTPATTLKARSVKINEKVLS